MFFLKKISPKCISEITFSFIETKQPYDIEEREMTVFAQMLISD